VRLRRRRCCVDQGGFLVQQSLSDNVWWGVVWVGKVENGHDRAVLIGISVRVGYRQGRVGYIS